VKLKTASIAELSTPSLTLPLLGRGDFFLNLPTLWMTLLQVTLPRLLVLLIIKTTDKRIQNSKKEGGWAIKITKIITINSTLTEI
jgi:hypothetical protein